LKKTKQRYSTQLTFDHKINDTSSFNFKNSYSFFNRKISIPDLCFDGTQQATFTEASYTNSKEKSEWVAGLNLSTDNFQEKQLDTFQLRDYNQITFGAFVQNSWKATKWLNLETGFRTDYVVDYGIAFLPRISALFKITNKFSSRIGGGFGYKSPTILPKKVSEYNIKCVVH
jgi:iron complex outermembrane receptor protein